MGCLCERCRFAGEYAVLCIVCTLFIDRVDRIEDLSDISCATHALSASMPAEKRFWLHMLGLLYEIRYGPHS